MEQNLAGIHARNWVAS